MIEVREAVVEDADAMANVNAAGWRAGYKGIVPDERLQNLPIGRWRREMRDGLRGPRGDSFTRIAEMGGTVAGYCLISAPARDEPDDSKLSELVAIYVRPQSWRRGVGRELITAAVGHAGELGYEEMYLWTFEHNQRALDFYLDFGFQPDGTRRDYQPLGIPTLRLRRKLG
jgi:ribosomal protein S18 acetylase RimI-like enzyme